MLTMNQKPVVLYLIHSVIPDGGETVVLSIFIPEASRNSLSNVLQ